MGGGYYDRDVIVSTGTNSYGNKEVGNTKFLNKNLDPKNYVSSQNNIISQNLNPIVFALDVTGSMGEWPKIIYDKFPMFYGQIMIKNYLKDPAISFCAVGDAICDDCPLQVTEFGQGKQIDQLIKKMYLEAGGGGNKHESYQLAAYFYNNYVKLRGSQISFFFVTGDEGYFDRPETKHYQKVLGKKPPGETVDALAEWKQLMKKYNVFHLKKQYDNKRHQKNIYKQWVDTLGEERVLKIENAKACVDIILGAICLTSGIRTLDTYVQDMIERGQEKQRIQEVKNALKPYEVALQTKKIKPVINRSEVQQAREFYKENVKIEPHKYREDLIKMKNVLKKDVPQTFYCPITGDIFFDPVMTADGQTYQRSAIQQWLKNHDTSPLTNQRLAHKTLMPNILIKKLIAQFHEKSLSYKA